jgi:hypothetical protein
MWSRPHPRWERVSEPLFEYLQYSMLLATVWRHAAICELYRDETSLCGVDPI